MEVTKLIYKSIYSITYNDKKKGIQTHEDWLQSIENEKSINMSSETK